MQPLTRHGHRGHAVFVLPARSRRAAGAGRQPPSAVRKTRAAAPRLIAPPAAPAAAPTAPAAPAAPAAGRPRTAKARAVWQPHRARPRRKILLLAARRDPSPRLPRRRKKSGRPRLNSGQPHGRAMPQATAGRQSARRMAATPRPSPPQNTPVGRAPRHAAPPAAPQKTLGPAAMPGAPPRHENSPVSRTPHAAPCRPACRAAAKSPAKHPTGCTPSQNTRPPPVRAGGAFPVCPFRSFL